MKRKWTPRLLIENVEYEIAQLEYFGEYEQANGIRRLFEKYVNENEIKKLLKRLEIDDS